jgi:hypothetical protein
MTSGRKKKLRIKEEIGIENGIGIKKDNEKSSQLWTKNVAFSSLYLEKATFSVRT